MANRERDWTWLEVAVVGAAFGYWQNSVSAGIFMLLFLLFVAAQFYRIETLLLERLQERWKSRRTHASKDVDESAAEDWDFLWNNVPELGKEELRRFVEDDELRRRAQELNLWHDLWHVAPEEAKQQLRHRWKAAKIPPRVSG